MSVHNEDLVISIRQAQAHAYGIRIRINDSYCIVSFEGIQASDQIMDNY